VDLIREINDLNRRKKQVLEEKRETAMNKEAEARKNLDNLEKEAQKNEDDINKVRNLISDHNKGGDPQRRHSGIC
jgi:vacuolar-type H+-ATPase subunit I/STV1